MGKVNGMTKGNHYRAHFRTWFDQAGRKKRRSLNRQKKAASLAPRPAAGLLRPVVHPPTQRYNFKLRLGKGFTLDELREAKISPKLAPTIGISVDHRRRNRCTESLQTNVERLKEYMTKLKVFPKRSGKNCVKKGDTPRSELENVAQNTLKEIIPVPKTSLRIKARAITADEKDFGAFKKLRKARTDLHYWVSRRRRPKRRKTSETYDSIQKCCTCTK